MDLTVHMATTLHLLSAALHTLFLHDHHNLNHDTPAQPGLRGPPRSAQRTDPAAYSGFRRSCGYTHGHVSQCHGTSWCSSTSRRFGASTDSILSSRVAVALATLPLASLSGMILGVTLHARLVALCLAGAHERPRGGELRLRNHRSITLHAAAFDFRAPALQTARQYHRDRTS